MIDKWLSDDCKPCLVEHVVEGYDEIYHILIELDDHLREKLLANFSSKKIVENVINNLETDDTTGIGTLAAAYANRGIIKDRNKNYQGALEDYIKALGIDHKAVAGPGLGTVILNYKFKSSSVKERALYLNEQLQLPEDERVLSIQELDEGQVMHKPGKL